MPRPANLLWFILPCLALLVSCLPLLTLRFPQGWDWGFELVRVAQFKDAMLSGQFPPYWGSDLYGGFGSPIFLFFPPLYSLVSTACSFVTGSIPAGCSLALLIFSLTGYLSMKFLVQEALAEHTDQNRAAARIAGYFFLLSPYLMGDRLLSNANSEHAALCVFPIALYGLVLIERKPGRGALTLSSGLALTILGHNLTALIAMLMTLAAALLLYGRDTKLSCRITVLGSVLFALGLSLFFWLPALYYKPLVRIEQMTTGKFDFHAQFQPLISLFAGQFYSAGVLLPCLLLLLWSNRDRKRMVRRNLYYLAIGLSLCFLLLQTPLSMPVWEHLPFMALFQFPWRLMGPLALSAAIAVGLSAAWVLHGKSPAVTARHEALILLLCLLNAAPALIAHRDLPGEVADRLPQLLTGASIARQGLKATVRDEYLPRSAGTVEPGRAGFGGAAVPVQAPGLEVTVLEHTGTGVVLDTRGSSSNPVRFSRWHFPEWKCKVNGVKADLRMNRSGTLDLSIPPGVNRVELRLSPPYLRRAGCLVSLGCLLVWCTLALRRYFPCRDSKIPLIPS